MNNIKLTNTQFVEKSKKIHGDKYDYSLSEYNGSNKKVQIICKNHGKFEIRAYHHINGVGCKKCSDEKTKYNVLDTEKFIEKSIKIHGNRYDYSLSEYTTSIKNIKIICR